MIHDGKPLESLVHQVEALLVPAGFRVQANDRVFNDDGVQIAEFDILVEGRVGSTDMKWLIECRDRPGDGPAPGSWIEQLVGRRDRFHFNKVIAVSTTGFAAGAASYAEESGIELRSVVDIDPSTISDWLGLHPVRSVANEIAVDYCKFIVSPSESPVRTDALRRAIANENGNASLLVVVPTGDRVSPVEAFGRVLANSPSLLESSGAESGPRQLRVRADFPSEDDHFAVDTDLGLVRVTAILFTATIISRQSEEVPVSATKQYSRDNGEVISQTAFYLIPQSRATLSLEIHNLVDTGDMHIVLHHIAHKESSA